MSAFALATAQTIPLFVSTQPVVITAIEFIYTAASTSGTRSVNIGIASDTDAVVAGTSTATNQSVGTVLPMTLATTLATNNKMRGGKYPLLPRNTVLLYTATGTQANSGSGLFVIKYYPLDEAHFW